MPSDSFRPDSSARNLIRRARYVRGQLGWIVKRAVPKELQLVRRARWNVRGVRFRSADFERKC